MLDFTNQKTSCFAFCFLNWKYQLFFKQKNNSFPDVEDEDLSRAVEIHSIGSLNNANALYSDHQKLSSIFQNDDDDDGGDDDPHQGDDQELD